MVERRDGCFLCWLPEGRAQLHQDAAQPRRCGLARQPHGRPPGRVQLLVAPRLRRRLRQQQRIHQVEVQPGMRHILGRPHPEQCRQPPGRAQRGKRDASGPGHHGHTWQGRCWGRAGSAPRSRSARIGRLHRPAPTAGCTAPRASARSASLVMPQPASAPGGRPVARPARLRHHRSCETPDGDPGCPSPTTRPRPTRPSA